ncbi:glycosyl transferase family protein [Fimbriimonas ginsengisoli Gsoil 348]|uniref:Glycosyl transferase family protein n=1 Tax=Fimbriimonas ginsengisoli Gsoil 348 TaxID=661478 RepID=A0A068NUM4_FIMGI|nr:glycosyl transferase family protein [Fimbriimonas ginsengisoli Gsoil 348]
MVWLFALLPLLGWWAYGLLDLDEGFYGAITAEMNRRGEWITPFYNGKPWFEKPILLYWLAKPSLALFGDLIGPRLPSVLCTFGTYLVVAWFARKRFGVAAAQLAVLILAGSLLVVGAGRMMLTDPPLVLCLTAAMLTFWESLVENPRWRIATAALIGLAILAKGPVAAILFLLIAGWTYWREPTLRPRFRGYWLAGGACMLLIIASWYVPAYLANGKLFVDKFLIEQNIGRFTGGDAAHTLGIASLPLYVPILFLGMIPWSIWIWGAWPRWPQTPAPDSPVAQEDLGDASRRYLAAWGAIVFVFFSISGAKLPHYILPVFPPFAILVGIYLQDRAWAYRLGLAMCAAMCLIANGVFIAWYRISGQAEAHALIRYVRQAGGDVALYQLGRRNKELGTGKPKLQETSLPSLLLYLDKNALDTDNFGEILSHRGPILVFTRANRVRIEDFATAAKAGRRLEELFPTVKLENFKLYRVR